LDLQISCVSDLRFLESGLLLSDLGHLIRREADLLTNCGITEHAAKPGFAPYAHPAHTALPPSAALALKIAAPPDHDGTADTRGGERSRSNLRSVVRSASIKPAASAKSTGILCEKNCGH